MDIDSRCHKRIDLRGYPHDNIRRTAAFPQIFYYDNAFIIYNLNDGSNVKLLEKGEKHELNDIVLLTSRNTQKFFFSHENSNEDQPK